jgi:hypothetical protein
MLWLAWLIFKWGGFFLMDFICRTIDRFAKENRKREVIFSIIAACIIFSVYVLIDIFLLK